MTKSHKHYFCDVKCYGEWRSSQKLGFQSGANNPSFGKRYTEQEKKAIGQLVKQALTDPQWRIDQSARGKRNMQNPEYVAKLRNATVNLWKDPIYRATVLAHQKIAISTPEDKEKRREAGRKLWQDPAYRDKVITAVTAALRKKPNQQEKRLDQILQKHLPGIYEFTGDGKVILGGMIPDFTDVNGRKDVLELFGDYWHTIKKGWKDNELGKIMAYNALGYDCLVIWEHELKDEQAVVAKIQQFRESIKRHSTKANQGVPCPKSRSKHLMI